MTSMANGNPEQEDKPQTQQDHAKKPYEKPAFRFEQVFVTSALTCGKIDATDANCHFNRKVS
jgi:hypothetical protein